MSLVNQPLVSVVIPTYNRAHLISEAVDSVLQQTYRHLEVIVVDDGSTDDTLERLKAYGDRIQVLAQKNSGPAAARNHGMAASRGELIAFLDSDDLWLPSKIERQVSLLQRAGNSSPCCLSNILMKWSDVQRASFDIAALRSSLPEGLWLNPDEVLVTRFVLFNQGIMIRREVLERMGGFDESLWYLEDHEMSLRLSLEGPWTFVMEPLVIWRETKSGSLYQKAQKEELKWKKPMVQILEAHLARLGGDSKRAGLRKLVQRELDRARRHLHIANLSQAGSSRSARFRQKVEDYRSAFFRRSPSFPHMKTQPCQAEKPARQAVANAFVADVK